MPALLAVSRDTQAAKTDGMRLLAKSYLTMMSVVGGEEIRRSKRAHPSPSLAALPRCRWRIRYQTPSAQDPVVSPAPSPSCHLPNINFMLDVSRRRIQMQACPLLRGRRYSTGMHRDHKPVGDCVQSASCKRPRGPLGAMASCTASENMRRAQSSRAIISSLRMGTKSGPISRPCLESSSRQNSGTRRSLSSGEMESSWRVKLKSLGRSFVDPPG